MATAARRAHRGEAVDGHGCAGVRAFHAVSSSADPDQADGHEPRPSVTIRQRGLLAAVVDVMVGPTVPAWHAAQWVRASIAQPRLGVAQSGCAAGRGSCAFGLRSAVAQYGRESPISSCARSDVRMCRPPSPMWQWLLRMRVRRWPRCGERVCAVARRGVGGHRGEHGSSHGTRGRACGGADHDPDHGLRIPIVTVVGVSWSVVRSGTAGFLKVSNHTF